MSNIPEQYTGVARDVEEEIYLDDISVAKNAFKCCARRMLNVNEWEKIASGLSAAFQLTDDTGKPVQRLPQRGDHFKINIPASGEHDRYDWVEIEEIQKTQSLDGLTEAALIRVRPGGDPQDPQYDQVKHFFSDAATSTFLVSRRGKKISAGVYSRNEKPNISATKNIGETLRNAVVAIGAMAGFSGIQWNSLVKGILEIQD